MSWLDSSPKRPLGKSKDVSHPGAKGGWGPTIPTSTRTYGSTKRRTAATVRNSSASRGLFAGGSRLTASSDGAVFSPMHEEDAAAVSSGDSSRLSPPLDSFRKGASLVSYGSETDFRVEAGSPEEEGSPPSVLPKNDGLRISRAVKPSNAGVGGRSRRAPCRTRGATAEDALAVGPCGPKSSGREASGVRGEVSKRRAAGARKNRGGGSSSVSTVLPDSGGDAGERTGSGSVGSTGTKLSPSKRRERSPGRKGGGRPERGVDRATLSRKPSSRLQSPLRSITNNSSSEGDRGCPRSKSKSGAVGDTGESPADSGSSSSGEEWQDDTNRPKRREKIMGSPQLDAQQVGDVQSPLPVQRTLEELEELEGSPLQAMTPSRSPPRATGESSFSLDSSLEGILVGDKRPRGNSRGKRTARGTEESAHRSSRSRHLSPMIPVTAGSSSHAFAVDEEGGDSEAAIVDLLSPNAEGTKLAPEAPVAGEKEPSNGSDPDLLRDSESATMRAPAPSARFFHLRRAASVGSFGSAPALAHSTSPRLALKRPSRGEGDGVTITPALGKTTAARELEEWGESPPPRLSRSLSLSQTSAWSGSGGSGSGSGSGCGKVTRISSRRRSRASSTSSPLPVPELSVSLTAGNMGEKLSALTTGGAGSRGSRSVGSGGGTRREQRRLRTSMIASLEGLGEKLLGDIGTASSRGAASSLRCHQVVSMGQAQPVRRERPTSLPNGLDLSNLGEVELTDRGELDEACLGGDPGVGWVLRAPGAPLLGERSRSFASTFQGMSHGDCMRPLTVLDGTDGVMTASGVSSSSSRIRRSSRRSEGPGGPVLDGGGGRARALEFSPTGMYVTSTRTPQSSYRTISAVRHRSSNLSSVARRMDRLEIRSDHVDTQATQAQKAIMGSPGEQQWNSRRMPSVAIVTSASTGTSTGASVGGSGMATTSATREPAPETSPREQAPQAASTPTRVRSVVALPQLHLTPLEPSNERLSMGSVTACSPSACLRDYLSGSCRRQEEAPLEEERTPSTPSMRITASPVGIRRSRSATASASSPVVPGLFGSSRKGCAGPAGISLPEGAELDLPRRVKDSRGNGSIGSGLVDSRVQGRAVSPAKPRKGLKSRPQPKTTSVSSGALVDSGGCGSAAGLGDSGEDGPECGFLIRRKSMSHASSTSPDWKHSLGHTADTTRSPAHFPRFGLGNNAPLEAGGDAEMQSPVLESQDRDARRRRNFSSPFPLASGDECGTPSAFLNRRGGGRETARTTKLSSDTAGDTDPASADSGEALLSRMSDGVVHEMGSSQRPADTSPTTAPAAPDVAAVVSAASESRPRRNSIESVGCTTGGTSSRPQFETPQPETKLRWGSRPQYGDWGISQPASARTLKRLAGRLMAFAGRAAGGRFSCGTPDSEQRLLTHASPGATPQRPFAALAATSTDTTPRGDSRLPRPSPGSSRSNHRQSFGFRNSLGTLSERGEFGMGMLTPKAETEVSGDAEQVTEDDDAVGGLDVAEAGMGEGAVVRGGEQPESGSVIRGLTLEVIDAIGRDGEGNERGFTSLGGLIADDQREACRRRQKKAKMRRVSMSIKSRKSSVAALGALSMAGGNVRSGPELGLPGVAGAGSPGSVVAAGNAHGRHRNHRRETTDGNLATGRERQRARDFVGAREGVISEREDEDEEDSELDSTPVAAEHGPGGHADSPSSLERRCGSGEAKMRLLEEGKGETPAKVREDLERSLTELTNLSLSMCHSESDDSPSKCVGTPSKSFMLGLESLEDRVQAEPAPVSTVAAAAPTAASDERGASVAAGRHGGKGSFEFLRLHGVMAKVLCMLSFDELLGDVPVVCAAWRRAATLAFAEVASESGDMSDGARPGDGDSDDGGDGRRRRRRGGAAAGASGTIPPRSASRHRWTTQKLVEVFPWGGFLSEGSFKQVFKVWNVVQSRMEALSVMNRELVAESGSEEVVSQELRVSILASSLVQRGICPNFVQTFGLFRSDEPPPPKVFGDSEVKYPCGRSPGIIRSKPHSASACRRAGLPLSSVGRSRSTGDGELRYQFIGMELCQYGDAEALIRAQPDGLLPLHEATACLFQMVFALYAGRVELSLRHADVKLLNFLVANGAMVGNGPSSLSKTHRGRSSRRQDVDDRGLPSTPSETSDMGGDDDDGDGEVVLVYGIGREVVQLRMPEDRAFVVKLADFGTADVNPATIGESVCAGHFTTLENTPMEHLSCGNDAQQTYAGDTFALALAAVHLYTGDAPYEELMEEVECPDELYDALANAWSDHSQYSMICDIILDGVPDEEGGGDNAGDEQREDGDDDQDPTLMNTFYRRLVYR